MLKAVTKTDVCVCSITQSYLPLCNPMACSLPDSSCPWNVPFILFSNLVRHLMITYDIADKHHQHIIICHNIEFIYHVLLASGNTEMNLFSPYPRGRQLCVFCLDGIFRVQKTQRRAYINDLKQYDTFCYQRNNYKMPCRRAEGGEPLYMAIKERVAEQYAF